MCTAFSGLIECQGHLEGLACAMSCNPTMGDYVTVENGTNTLSVCQSYADKIEEKCLPILGEWQWSWEEYPCSRVEAHNSHSPSLNNLPSQ